MIEIRVARQGDLTDLPCSSRAVVVIENGTLLGHAGVYLSGAAYCMFSCIPREHRRRHARLIIRAWRILLNMVKDKGLPIHAIADPQLATSRRFLEHFGFRHLVGDIYELGPNG